MEKTKLESKVAAKNRIVPLFAFTSVALLASCSLFQSHKWNWKSSTANDSINYCLLIGQLDHNDSMFRTRGVRQELNTRVDKEQQKDNYNLEDVKTGTLTLDGDASKGVPSKTYTVNELEHLEQKSFAGATWDPITANATAGTWISKHGKNITMFVSNNDGMAEGAIKAHNWYEGMPIFGYDANTSTLKLMKQNRILGTIDSNTPAQCLATSMLIRNLVDNKAKIEEMAKNKQFYNPLSEGFSEATPYNNEYFSGYMKSSITASGCEESDFITDKSEGEDVTHAHAVLLNNRTVTNDKYVGDKDGVATDQFFKENGEALDPDEKYALSEGKITVKKAAPEIKIWQSWYSDTDTFFSGNMDPYFRITQSEKMFNIAVTEAKSNGADESKNLNALDSALTKDKYDAFLINPVQQPNSIQYLTKIANYLKLQEKDSWYDRDPTPIIFWNRQPTDRTGKISKNVMNNKYFKYVYYVGFDAKQGGELQGQMVKAWLNKTYVENYKK